MAQHTPGPWSVEEYTRIIGAYAPQRTLWVCNLYGDEEDGGVNEICELQMSYRAGIPEANGRLIAAAPEMMALLQECRACVPAIMREKIERLAARVTGEGQ